MTYLNIFLLIKHFFKFQKDKTVCTSLQCQKDGNEFGAAEGSPCGFNKVFFFSYNSNLDWNSSSNSKIKLFLFQYCINGVCISKKTSHITLNYGPNPEV